MGKFIKMTSAMEVEARKSFDELITKLRGGMSDGKIVFTKTFQDASEKASIVYTDEAWEKQQALVSWCEKEIAWHGVASRLDPANNIYQISDIVVYPQTVTSATVEMDVEKYSKWLMDNYGDPRFESLKMQGHSHVNMATTPSQTDLTHQSDIVSMLGPDDFYIFMIWNKKGVCTSKIYDMAKNIMFEDKDIKVIRNDKMAAFIEEAKGFIEEPVIKVYTPVQNYEYGMYRPGQSSKGAVAGSSSVEKPRVMIGAGWMGKDNVQRQAWDED